MVSVWRSVGATPSRNSAGQALTTGVGGLVTRRIAGGDLLVTKGILK